MKRFLFFIAAGLFLILGCCSLFESKGTPGVIGTANVIVASDGKTLVMNMCGTCHYDSNTNALTGVRMLDMPRLVGKIYSSDITSDSGSSLKNYSDADLATLIKTGRTKKGNYLPYMVCPTIADKDLYAIISFLRSVENKPGVRSSATSKTVYSLAGSVVFKFLKKNIPFIEHIDTPDMSNDSIAGAYYVNIFGCYHCHSGNPLRLNYLNPPRTKGYLAGGFKFHGLKGDMIRASNLTPDTATGIGYYNEHDFFKVLSASINRKKQRVRYPMRQYSSMTALQAHAIFFYLKSLKPIVNNKLKTKG